MQTQTETQRGQGRARDGERQDLGFWNLLFQVVQGIPMKETKSDRCPRPFPAPWSIFMPEGDIKGRNLGGFENKTREASGQRTTSRPSSLAPLT